MSKFAAVTFIFGAAIGSVTTWYFTKTHYEKIAQDEIDSVKEAFSVNKKTDTNDEQEDKQHKADIAKAKPDLMKYATKLREEGYVNYSEHGSKNTRKEEETVHRPYVISPDEYGELDDYDQVSLTYYAGDEILADDTDDIVEDIFGTVGADFASHFGEYEDDSVFIRNDTVRCDYEILKDTRSYNDVANKFNY